MNTIHQDFAAFRTRLLSPVAAQYERREAPDAPNLADTIEKIADGFDAHKQTVSELRSQVDRLETRLSRPGALTGQTNGQGATKATAWTVNGEPAQVLHGAEEIRSHFEKRADAGGEIRISDFLRGVANMGGSPEARAVLSVGTDADGGHMVPTRLMGGVLSAMVPESSVMTAGAGVLALDAANFGAKGFTLAAVDTIPTAAWRAENGAVSESSPGFRAVLMAPKSLSFYFKVSREWLMDAAGTDPVLTTAIAQAFAKELDRAALRGSGSAPQPAGVLNTAGILSVTNGANGASLGTTKYANVFSAVQLLLENNAPMPTAMIGSPRSQVTLGALVDTTGQPLQRPQMLDPVRMLSSSQVPNNLTVGTSNDCSELYLGDWSKLVYAMRERMSIQMLNEVFATSGQVGFLCHVRADIALTYPKAFAVVTGVRA